MYRNILLTGPTGYIGLRLAPRLIEKGYKLRCVSRNVDDLKSRPWAKNIELFKADLIDRTALDKIFDNIDIAFYLMHSMGDKKDFSEQEKIIAKNFAEFAYKHKLKKVIYLGALGSEDEKLSRHLESRHRVGEILRSILPNVIEFRAGVIVGSGSISFEMIRYVCERFPVIPNFDYIKNSKCQPIAIRDVLSYLISAIENEKANGEIIEIGCPRALTYLEMLKIYSEIRGLKKIYISLPTLPTYICAGFISLFTPIPYNISRALLESLKNNVVKTNDRAMEIFPEIKPIDYETAVKYALIRISENNIESIWTTSYIPPYHKASSFLDSEGLILMDYNGEIYSNPEKIYKIFTAIGGKRGYYFAQLLWNVKAWQDKLIGGIGMRIGRRHPEILYQGETLDFWRVERIINNRMLLLRAEMKLPGKGWLQFYVKEIDDKKSFFRITAYFEPKGFLGYIYWYLLYPVHHFVFKGLIRKIKEMAEEKREIQLN